MQRRLPLKEGLIPEIIDQSTILILGNAIPFFIKILRQEGTAFYQMRGWHGSALSQARSWARHNFSDGVSLSAQTQCHLCPKLGKARPTGRETSVSWLPHFKRLCLPVKYVSRFWAPSTKEMFSDISVVFLHPSLVDLYESKLSFFPPRGKICLASPLSCQGTVKA